MGTLVVGAIVLSMVVLAAYKTYKDYKTGKSCGGGCAGCAKACGCPGQFSGE